MYSVIPGRSAAGAEGKGTQERHERATRRLYPGYILASRRNGTLYIGVINDLLRRVVQHKALAVPGFTRKYRVTILVYAER